MLPAPGPRVADVVLPCSLQAIQETPIYSRVDGYLKRRLVDLGDRVQAGQVLAEIDTPDLDQQLAQARASLASTEAALAQARSGLLQAHASLRHNRATLEYTQTVLGRWGELRKRGLVAEQDVDDKRVAFESSRADVEAAEANVGALEANVTAAQANTEASRANVQRLVELQGYQRVRAPFAGVVTVRNVDTGALIATGSTSTNTPMFRLSQTDDLRVLVNVPQTFVNAIRPGATVKLLVREFPGRTFDAKVFSNAGALDPASRTLLTELRMHNAGDVIRPGMYADVRFNVERDNPPLLIPTSALIVRTGSPQVAIVGPDDKVRIQAIELGRDFGITIEVTQGLDAKDRLIVTPPDGVQQGMKVKAVAPPKPKGA
jgi:multidrug efflux pump subunit AcrA (membrane-fusion protein)